ncbi:hypothetical protein ACFYKT_16510 [Cytobacillus sp. FJAT-53684]|uniref:Inhibitor of sigma-G Gin n=1 Tax=Cytobacillus mangrovibacter TaxID=3299024 RepID=A0ABW6K196_9BACI
MCQLCNGTHVVHDEGDYCTIYHCCPNCGPIPDEQWLARIQAVYEWATARKVELDRLNLVKEVC